MKKHFLSLLLLLALFPASVAQQSILPQVRYVEKYAAIAVNEMYRSGVPASITLAQGIIESASGQSVLAVKGNNHFGIKCHKNWTGATMRADDDRKNECFRVYDNAEASFRDHSDFLRYRDRYKFLFDLPTTDYKGWSYGLKQAGYATDPSYAAKLIKCIEDYDLTRYDNMTVEEVLMRTGSTAQVPEEVAPEETIPESPNNLEAATLVPGAVMEEYRFSLSRQLYSRNGVPFLYAVEGETYRSIAKDYHLFLGEILRFNDLKEDERLMPGTIVYLQSKKKKAAPGLDKYIVGSDTETLRGISQRFAIKQKALLKLNNLSAGASLQEGDELLLRPAPRPGKKQGRK